MTSLRNFPTEILAQILNTPQSSNLVINLWKSGDRILQHKIASCITILDIRDTRVGSSSRYPKLISCLPKLTSLRIERGRAWLMSSPILLSYELAKLPPSLTSLTLSSADSPRGLLNYGSDGKVINSKYPRGESELYNWGKVFPSLESLEIADFEHDTSISPTDFAGLPPTLTRLRLPTFRILSSLMLQTLPPSLTDTDFGNIIHKWTPKASEYCCLPLQTTLKLKDIDLPAFEVLGTSWTSRLPTQLTSLQLPPDLSIPPSHIATLPQSLTHIKINVEPGPTEAIIRWPSSLRSLCIYNAFNVPNLWQLMPKNLEKLVLSSLDEEVFDSNQVPRSVTEMQLLDIFADDTVTISSGLPDSLLKLVIKWENACEGVIFESLPPKLTHLDIDWTDCFSNIHHKINWPPQLSKLRVNGLAMESCENLPSSLTDLNVTKFLLSFDEEHNSDDDESGFISNSKRSADRDEKKGMKYGKLSSSSKESLFDQFLLLLPVALNTLVLEELESTEVIKFDTKTWRRFKSLKSLYIPLRNLSPSQLPAFFSILPPTITSLTITGLHGLHKLNSSYLVEGLPVRLKLLHLRQCQLDYALVTDHWPFSNIRLFIDDGEYIPETVRERAAKYPDPRVIINLR